MEIPLFWLIGAGIFYVLEKVVHLSKAKWDDIVVDGLIFIFNGLRSLFQK